MVAEGLFPRSQEPAAGPIISQMKPVHTSPSYFLKIHSLIKFPPMPSSPYCPLSFLLSYQISVRIPLLYHASYMACPSNLSWLNQPHYSQRRVQVMKLIIIKFSPAFFQAIPLTTYTAQHPEFTFLTQYRRPCFTPIQNYTQTSRFYIFSPLSLFWKIQEFRGKINASPV
jgi:hypothetical protein